MVRIKVIYPNGDADELEVHEVVVEESSAKIFVRDDQLVIARDDSDEKW